MSPPVGGSRAKQSGFNDSGLHRRWNRGKRSLAVVPGRSRRWDWAGTSSRAEVGQVASPIAWGQARDLKDAQVVEEADTLRGSRFVVSGHAHPAMLGVSGARP